MDEIAPGSPIPSRGTQAAVCSGMPSPCPAFPPPRETEKPVKWLNKFKSDILAGGAKAVGAASCGTSVHNYRTGGPDSQMGRPRERNAHPNHSGPHPRVPTFSAPGSARPGVSRRFSAPGVGASPAGLSAAIVPPQLGFLPAGGVASTPAAELAAVLDLGVRLCAHRGSGPLSSGLGSG